ncbi:choice-of-anchor L domain-containing protein [Winogradskyella poriferorum]|uniref:choice-of-anchor L domain-containing protein n=1 Tax=Winogradskyella poriferorum TaxID=307627 RepID=UPI003D65D088
MFSINRILLGIFCLLSTFITAQQITVDNSVSPQDLVENTLIQGCVEVSNISSPINGSISGLGSFGYFERANSSFPFENGIVLTTGNALSAGNGQNNSILNEGDNTWSTDTDLETALGITGTLNATSIEFDFVSISNQIQFNYILASEEYSGNFPCQYSDGFALLIRQAGSGDPYTNIALVPGTSTPVNTNTVHDEIVGFCDASNGQYFEGYNIGDTNYNGRTSVLTAIASIQPNVQYQVKLVIADQTDQNYDSAVFIEGSSFNASVDLGEDIQTCASSVLLDGNIQNPQASYTWYFNNALIPGETNATFDAVQSGTYRVVIEIPLPNGICTIEDDVTITLSSTQPANAISNYEVCDDSSNDGVESFDLSTKDAEVFNAVPTANYVISYHANLSDASSGSNPITAPIQNIANPQTIYVRIENVDNGCLAFTSFDLVVNEMPNITNPTPLEVCDDQIADGFTTIDLSVKDTEITNGQPNLDVTYHYTLTEAQTGSNPIPMPYVNTSTNETVFVNVQNSITGCNTTTTLDISVLDNPVVNSELQQIDACDLDHDGFADFDLTTVIPDVIQGLTDVTVTFHETYDDALIGSNSIGDSLNYSNINPDVQTVFIRVESNISGCGTVVPLEIHTNLLLTGTNIRDVSQCDVDNDNYEEFDLFNIADGIINDLDNVTVVFYESEEDRDNQVNPISPTQSYIPTSNPQTLFLALESSTCQDEAEISLIMIPVQEFDPIDDQTVCDEDQDGFSTIELSQFDDLVTQGQPSFSVSYYLSESDADSNTNALPNFYTNTTNPFTVYPRIQSLDTGCHDVNSFEITVLEAPVTSTPSSIVICDIDQDGFFIVNLENSSPEVITDTTNRSINFYNTLQNAENGVNPIIDTTNYNAETETVYVRVNNTITGCYSIENLEIIVNTLPVFAEISNYRICEDSSDGVAEFMFNTKDNEILNGQSGKQVLYYLSQSDADNRINAINKNANYQNISNPQTIYARVENITDQDCYGTSDFIIEVGTNPAFNIPIDWFVCDDISNDGFETFDFTDKITEITQGIPDNLNVTFYTSQFNAENSINPLPLSFTNTVNPQQIYVQIDNGTICNSITSFELNVIQVPEVNPSQPLTQCDTDDDGIVIFDLTVAEFNILDVRQDNIEIAYFRNLADVENNTNQISDPENYQNTSNPEVVYLKVTNTISNCHVAVPIDLEVFLPPSINDFQLYDICENNSNSFDLSEIDTVITDSLINIEINYYTNLADAESDTNALNTNYTYQTNSDTLFARVAYTTTHCYSIYDFSLNVNMMPPVNPLNDLIACDDDFDGLLEFDLSVQNNDILNGLNPQNYSISYHNTENDAINGDNIIESSYIAFDEEIIFVRLENNNTSCFSVNQFSININPLPEIDIPDQVICLDDLPLIVSANTNVGNDQYLWSTGATTPEIQIDEIGTYWVTVTTSFGCENTRVFNVSESEAAIIEITETVDFSDPNNITITVSGIGDYLYQLDDFEPQESNVFENVGLGYHTITVIDLNGCSEVTEEVIVIDAPKHMTPNNDGDFDTWHIVGIETLPGSIVYIFDRYGKLLKQLGSNTSGWDGTFNGNKMPSSDYWYVAQIQQGNESFEVKGHFTLRR